MAAKGPVANAALVVLALIGGLAIAVYWHWSSRSYAPIAAVLAPGGVTYTAFSDETRGRDACAAANARFVQPLMQQCPACTVLFERCEDKAHALELRLAAGRSHLVSMPGLHIGVAGPQEVAKTSCELIAADLGKHGVSQGRCIAPRVSSTASN